LLKKFKAVSLLLHPMYKMLQQYNR